MKMQNIKISVITVVKNGMPYLQDAIRSFDEQSLIEKEQIIIYSPSNDDTEKFLLNLNNKKKIIKDKISKNKFGSINIGIHKARGEIVGLLHSDDVFTNNSTLEDVYNFYKRNNADLIYGNIKFCKKDNLNKIVRFWKSEGFQFEKLKYGWMPPHTSIYVKKDIIKQTPYSTEYPVSGDYKFILDLFTNNNIKKKYFDKTLCIMRSGGDSTKISKLFQKFNEDLKIAKIFFNQYIFCIFLKITRKLNQFFF